MAWLDFGDRYISVLGTRDVLISDLCQQTSFGLIVVFLGAEESSCRGEGAELSHNTWEYPDFPSSENNNWAAFCVFGLEQRVPFLIKGTVWICHPLHARCRVKLLEEWASDEH